MVNNQKVEARWFKCILRIGDDCNEGIDEHLIEIFEGLYLNICSAYWTAGEETEGGSESNYSNILLYQKSAIMLMAKKQVPSLVVG